MKNPWIRRAVGCFLVSSILLLAICVKEWRAYTDEIPKKPKGNDTEVSAEMIEDREAGETEDELFIGEQDTEGATEEGKTTGISGGKYAYLTLGEEAKKVYDEIVDVILKHQEKINVSTLNVDILEDAYRAVCADYGGLFWVSGYVYTQYTRGGELVEMEFSPKYTMSYDDRVKYQTQIDESVEELLAGISIQDSDYEKAKYVFEILIQNVDYDAASENNQNIISVFLNRSTVCQGYACGTQYLLNILGVESTIVNGTANGESHAWNLVKLDGEYYYMDTTWGNSRYLNDSSETAKYVNYNYLAVTSEEISRTHVLDTSFPLPECTQTVNNYFVREGKYFEQWEPDAVGEVLNASWVKGQSTAAVKFSSSELYEQAIAYFITDQRIADYCENISSVYYLEDPEQYILTMNFGNK